MATNHDDFLYQYQETPDPDFTTRLRDQLLAVDRVERILPPTTREAGIVHLAHGMRRRSWSGRIRALIGGVALLGTLMVTPLHVLATDILYQLGLVQITNDPTYADMIVGGQTPTPQPTSIPQVSFTFDTEMTDLATIQSQAGYSVYQLNGLPPGSRVVDRDIQHVVDADYATATMYQLKGQLRTLILVQAREGKLFTQMPVGQAQTESVTINGHAGVWIEGFTFLDQEAGVMESNNLIWNADGFTFYLSGVPSKEEGLLIAASLELTP
ncbi:MAG TPA: hypothetical protein DEF47_01830 [Herpetosiphon sp.]|uniref:DUF4367 domain-containing protein n=1 Tax=Herpetosiphon aurantiacus (strain ATCC 23779 / DSM 785 / 114-95) TaxID=316274 RepID=A9AVG9_HERA2|nr:hypothetical protein [Herpetosiphon sp.]ABX04660.1 hypothetical protein Haur_2017 [Herpetosiphon aurantiacus DSM 785]HBW48626.1 hypothetical protein [Herpetosiphon sp.]